VEDALAALDNTDFSAEELEAIDRFAVDGAINIWARSSDAG
jgi:L-glyceraldehyde 3-phosphate reductase